MIHHFLRGNNRLLLLSRGRGNQVICRFARNCMSRVGKHGVPTSPLGVMDQLTGKSPALV
jgi:hypothetical protein